MSCCCISDMHAMAEKISPRGALHSLYSRLAKIIPAGSHLKFYHASTPPTKGDPLFAPAPGEKQQRTYCESQFLTVTINRPDSSNDQEILIFAIEVLVYTTKTLTTLFVSKADSTGYISLLDAPQTRSPSPIRPVTSTFVSWLAENRQRPGVSLVVSLFARAQDQYLFPGSVENAGKHVLDDRQLVKWWCKTLDPVLRRDLDKDREATAQGYVIVPGFDKYETSQFFPPTHRTDPTDARKWQHGHPLRDIAPNPTAPPRCLVPHFPDDPKARYLDELDDEIPDQASSQTLFSPSKKGQGVWKSIKTLDQFWDTMAFRQECSSGRLVGFIWLVFTPSEPIDDSRQPGSENRASLSPSRGLSQGLSAIPRLLPSRSREDASPEKRRRRKKLTGPIIPRQPKIKSSTSGRSTATQSNHSLYYTWPEDGRGQVVVDHASYTRWHDLLLRLDFANADAATNSTRRWIDEVKIINGTTTGWGETVEGLAKPSSSLLTATSNGAQPNNLSGMLVRKKRKPESAAAQATEAQDAPPGVNVLGSGLIRKKPKVIDS